MNIQDIIIEERIITFNDIINKISDNTLKYKKHCLTNHAKSQIIENIILRMPLPSIICTIDTYGNIITAYNGSKIIESVDSLINDRMFTMSGISLLTELNNTTLKDIPHHIIRRIKETKINLVCIRETTPEVAQNILKKYEKMEG